MTKRLRKPDFARSKGFAAFEYALLALCLCVLALRVTLTESPTMQSVGGPGSLRDVVYSLSVSAILTFSFMLWLVWNLFAGRRSYRRTGIEIGLGIFLFAAVIACFAARDKRIAITDAAVLVAPIIMALLLVQILHSKTRIALVLVVVAALAVVNAQQSADQLLNSNKVTIAEYERLLPGGPGLLHYTKLISLVHPAGLLYCCSTLD